MNIKINKIIHVRVKNYLNSTSYIIFAIMLFFLASTQVFTYKSIQNFWNNFYYSIGNGITNTIFFCLLFVNTIIFIREKKIDHYLYNRLGKYEFKIKYDLYSIIIVNVFLFLIFIIFNISFSILISFNNFNITMSKYNIIMPIQITIEIIKYLLYVILTSLFIGLSINVNGLMRKILFLIFILMTIIPTTQNFVINNIFESSIQYTFFINHMNYISINTDLISTVLNMNFILIVNILLYKATLNKKVDIL